MTKIEEILEFNKKFVANKKYEPYIRPSAHPAKKMVILTCMDTRLVELLQAALNIKNGDVKMIKNAGALITDPFGQTMRSILVAIHELGAEDVLVIPHHECGMNGMNSSKIIGSMKENGITQEQIDSVANSGVDLDKWFKGFTNVEDSVVETVNTIKNHPFIPANVRVHGFVIDLPTGELSYIVKG